jgi:hypothetical protein
MYIRVFFGKESSFAQTVEDDKQGYQEGVAEYKEAINGSARFANGCPYVLKSIGYKRLIHTNSPFSIVASNQFLERVVYLDASDNFALASVLSADNLQELQQSIPAFNGVLQSLKWHYRASNNRSHWHYLLRSIRHGGFVWIPPHKSIPA